MDLSQMKFAVIRIFFVAGFERMHNNKLDTPNLVTLHTSKKIAQEIIGLSQTVFWYLKMFFKSGNN